MVPNYDNTMEEPLLLPTSFPNILVSPNMGIAVGMASKICSFNLAEVCDGAIQMLKNPDTTADRMLDIISAPDFSGGGYLLYNRDQLREIYETGRGSFKLRAKYTYDKQANCIDIVEIPYSTTIEVILKKIGDLVKEGKLKEITDFRDEIDLRGMTGDEAWGKVDKYFDEASIAGFHTVRLIHGKGTGALRNALWAYLKTDRRVKGFRIGQFGEGDGGVTVVELK